MLAVDPVLWDATLFPNVTEAATKEEMPLVLATITTSGNRHETNSLQT
jgi:hypothetical protein